MKLFYFLFNTLLSDCFLRCVSIFANYKLNNDCTFLSKEGGIVISGLLKNTSCDKSIYKPRWSKAVISLNTITQLLVSMVNKLNEQRIKSIWDDPSWRVLLFPITLCQYSKGPFSLHFYVIVQCLLCHSGIFRYHRYKLWFRVLWYVSYLWI